MLKPLSDRLVLKKEEHKEKTEAGIYIPQGAIPEEAIAIVMGKGSTVSDDLSVGDKVLYKEYSAVDVTVDKESLLIVKEEDIIAVVEEK